MPVRFFWILRRKVYEYQWYLDSENNNITPLSGSALKIPRQSEPRQFKVKLHASKNFEDSSFEVYETEFNVVVYVPSITLSAEGVQGGDISGSLENYPDSDYEDLSDIPFSIFRQRDDIWKNLGNGES